MNIDLDDYMTVSDAAKKGKVSRQSIYYLVKKKLLKAQHIGKQLFINIVGMDEYRKFHRRSRINGRRPNGELIWDAAKGTYSVTQIAKMFNASPMKIYYLIRTGYLPFEKVKYAYVLKVEDIEPLRDMI